MDLFGNIYKNKKVLITGHTGFKGSWLAYWLLRLEADIIGYSLEPPTTPNHYDLLGLSIQSITGDIRDQNKLFKAFEDNQPEIIFHLAAQPLVRISYQQPLETYETNIMGLINVFEACRKTASVHAIVNITSDKCYQNNEWVRGYRESDPMGGFDPYSSSKGCAELLTAAYRNSFFNLEDYGIKHQVLLASARAGNAIGGGDWAKERIMTDMMEAANSGKPLLIRNPQATRPWQYVLEPLSGYLLLGQKLLEGGKKFAEAWNFGPNNDASTTVVQMVEKMQNIWNKINYKVEQNINNPHEAKLLKLDCSKAYMKLHWKDVWDTQTAFVKTAEWYRNYYEQGLVTTSIQLESYINDARQTGVEWIH